MPFFKREPLTKVFYASDIHGSERLFVKFLNAAKVYKVSILIMGGDLAGKAVIPIVRVAGGYRCRFMGRDHELSTEAELKELRSQINYNGFYPYIADDDEYECPSGERLVRHMTRNENGMVLHRYWTSVCPRCPMRSQCTTGKERRVSRWEHEDVLERARISQMLERAKRERDAGCKCPPDDANCACF